MSANPNFGNNKCLFFKKFKNTGKCKKDNEKYLEAYYQEPNIGENKEQKQKKSFFTASHYIFIAFYTYLIPH